MPAGHARRLMGSSAPTANLLLAMLHKLGAKIESHARFGLVVTQVVRRATVARHHGRRGIVRSKKRMEDRAPQRQQRRPRRLELIVALGAVLVLGSIAVPAFTGYVARSRVARAVSDIGTLSLQLYRWQRDTGTLPTTLAEAGLGNVDPWGRPYVYLRVAGAAQGQLRKDGALERVNSDFDLYSLGPDGESSAPLSAEKSHDDVVRAKNGAYIGLAVNY